MWWLIWGWQTTGTIDNWQFKLTLTLSSHLADTLITFSLVIGNWQVKIAQMRKLSNNEVECNFARAASQRAWESQISFLWVNQVASKHSPQSAWNTTSYLIVLSFELAQGVQGKVTWDWERCWKLSYLTAGKLKPINTHLSSITKQKLTLFVGHLTVKLGMVVDVAELNK